MTKHDTKSTVQFFSQEYLTRCSQMTPIQVLTFLDDFRKLHGAKRLQDPQIKAASKLISIKMPVELLNAFRTKAELEGVRYQTQIKQLMKDWLSF